jgi:uncharacterized membrane protein
MLSGHFPALYGQRLSWLALLVLVAAGAVARHLLNIRFSYPSWRPALAATLATTVASLYLILRVGSASFPSVGLGSTAPVTFVEVRHVIDRRCGSCHSAQQSDRTFGTAPGGVTFDTPEQIIRYADRIRDRAVTTRTMPPGNKTGITQEERAVLGRWVAQGARPR